MIAPPAFGRLGSRRAVAVTTREGDLWVWRIRGRQQAWFWPRGHHDGRNTGLFAPRGDYSVVQLFIAPLRRAGDRGRTGDLVLGKHTL